MSVNMLSNNLVAGNFVRREGTRCNTVRHEVTRYNIVRHEVKRSELVIIR